MTPPQNVRLWPSRNCPLPPFVRTLPSQIRPTMASASLTAGWEKIDAMAEDGGLKTAFKLGPVHEKLVEKLMVGEGVTHLRDFVNMFPSGDSDEARKERDAEFKKVADEGPETKDKRVERGRLKTAWEAAEKCWGAPPDKKAAACSGRPRLARETLA